MNAVFFRATCACFMLTAASNGALAQPTPLDAAAIPGLRGAVITSLASFPWKQVACNQPRHLDLDPVISDLRSDSTFRLSERDLWYLQNGPYRWRLSNLTSSTSPTITHSDTAQIRVRIFPATLWPELPASWSMEPERQAARERWNAALKADEEVAVVVVEFYRCSTTATEGNVTGLAVVLLYRRGAKWLMDDFRDVILQ